MDRRLTPATSRVAHVSLRGQLDRPEYTEGTPLRVTQPLVDLLDAPCGRRDRQLWLGDDVLVIDRDQGHAFVRVAKDGYCGWLPETVIGTSSEPTHHVAGLATHLYPEPAARAREIASLPMGARLAVVAQRDRWAETPQGFIPSAQLAPLGEWATDPVAVAESFVGTPYLWGGNSRAGIDCSGLVQGAHIACGLACPADSDQQQSLGAPFAPDSALHRGDLVFWRGHVAMVTDLQTLIHANGHSMSVAYEPIAACIARIAAQDGGAVTLRLRPAARPA